MRIVKAGKILLYALAGFTGVVLLVLLGFKLALDRAPHYPAEIKSWLFAQTGYHVDFAHVSPMLRWYGPELHFDQLELRSKDNQRVLALARGGSVAVDIRQLLHGGRLLAGRVQLDSPEIAVTRLGADRFAIASEMPVSVGAAGGLGQSTLRADDLPFGTFAVRHAVITMHDWNPDLATLVVQDVSIDLRHEADGIGVLFAGQLPPELGGSASGQARVQGHGALSTLTWKGLALLRDLSFSGLHRLLPDYLRGLDSGSATFDISAQGIGMDFTRAGLDFSANGVSTRLVDGPVAKFDQMSGVLALAHDGDHWSISGRHVRAVRRDPESAFDISWSRSPDGLLAVRASASYLRIETLLPLAGILPQPELRERIRQIAPTGEWINTSLSLARATVSDSWRMQVQAQFRNAGFAPLGNAPGLRALTGSLAGDESGGHVFLDSPGAIFAWPTQFPQPVELELCAAKFYWQRGANGLLVASPGWRLKTHDAEVHGLVSWRQPNDDSSPILTLASVVENGNVANARNYFPRGLLAAPVLAWLNHAFVAGRMTHADAIIRGPVRNYPFRDGSGLFVARASFEGMTLNYSEGWPPAENVRAQAEFRNEGLTVRMTDGRLGDINMASAEARFADFNNGELRIKAAARGEAATAISYLRATPLNALASHAFSEVEAAGTLDANVDILLPFKDFAHRRVLVHGKLDDARVNKSGSSIVATDVKGDFDVDNAQVVHADIHGRALGGAFQLQARVPRNRTATRTQLELRGVLRADAVRDAFELPATMDIAGETDWRAVLKMAPEPAREHSLRISSTLSGLAMKLPAPLNKAPDTLMPSWFELQWPASGGPQGRFALGSLAGGSYVLESDGNGTRLAHASITFGTEQPAVGDSQILNVGGSLERVDLAGWLALSGGDKNAKPLSYYLRSASMHVGELDYLGLAFRDISINLTASDAGLHIGVGGANVSGSISIPDAGNPAPWNLQFDRLKFEVAGPDVDDDMPSTAARAVASGTTNPRSVPALEFHAAQLDWGERRFGDVRAALIKVDDGIRLKNLAVAAPGFSVNATGDWRGKDAGSAHVTGAVTSTDLQSTLSALGYADVIQAKSGKIDFDLNWLGAPTAAALVDAAGHVQVALDKGQVTGLKPGAGRVFGLASLAALPRRLSLDFSDLTDKGLAFDTIRGDFKLRNGNAYTDNVLLKGPAAEIGLIGNVDLKNKVYDQTAVVTGNYTSTLPVAALVGGPVVAGAVLLFTQVFKQPLKGLARGYYRITGPWDSPNVERIKSAEAGAAHAAGATAEAPR